MYALKVIGATIVCAAFFVVYLPLALLVGPVTYTKDTVWMWRQFVR